MRIVPLGVRGSTAAPGTAFTRYGGHTSCLAVITDGADAPHLVLDAGTGLRELPMLLDGAPFVGDIVLSHLHWDHVQGLPFCPSVDNPSARVRLHVPMGADQGTARDALAVGFSPPQFPIDPDGLLGSWEFVALREGPVSDQAGSAEIAAYSIAHKGGQAFGIRVDQEGTALAYLPDHAVTDPDSVPPALDTAFAGVDLLIHDGQYSAAEIATADAYGHATIEAAAILADRWEVGALLLTHHAPARTDSDLDLFAARYPKTPGGRPISFAMQGRAVDIG